MMATIGGVHVQAVTGRAISYWCAYDITERTRLEFVAVFNEGRALRGQHEGQLNFDPYGIPAAAVLRWHMVRHLDGTQFGAGRLPDRRWVGWYGPYL